MFNISPELKLSISAAASWAWGTSLVVGLEIARTKGLEAFGIWAVANASALVVFGLLVPYIKAGRVFGNPWIRAGGLLVQVFILVIQLNILARLAGGWVATVAGVLFVLLVYKRGLYTSILSDNALLPVVMLCLAVMVCAGFWSGVSFVKSKTYMSSSAYIGGATIGRMFIRYLLRATRRSVPCGRYGRRACYAVMTKTPRTEWYAASK